MSKHISKIMEWDEVVHLATAAYNFFPNEHSRESPFFLMFGRDPRIPLNTLLEPKIRYMGMDENILSLEALQRIYYMCHGCGQLYGSATGFSVIPAGLEL